jgi:hypothetical protein
MTERLMLMILAGCLAALVLLAPEADPGPLADAVREMNRE